MRRALAAIFVSALLWASCGSHQSDQDGAVSAETVRQLEDLLHARAIATGKGDRAAFLQTIDTTRAAFRRVQLRYFEVPTFRGGLSSTFKLSGVEHYRGYIRGFVEELLESNAFPGQIVAPSYWRYYFRNEGGRWIVTEPTGDETGPEKQRSADGVELGYWGMDEDLASVLLFELQEARRLALEHAPRPQQIKLTLRFIPTAELAGPAWDGFQLGGGGLPGTPQWFYPMTYGLGSDRSRLAPFAQDNLLFTALQIVRDGIAPGVGQRLFLNRWLDYGWLDYAAGTDASVTLKQACVGVPILTLKELADGTPAVVQTGVSPETYGRHYAFAESMVTYLIEKYGNETFWQLMSAFVQSASAATNFPAVLHTTPEGFYADWLVWLKKKYC